MSFGVLKASGCMLSRLLALSHRILAMLELRTDSSWAEINCF
jgi:hypothetical protein